MIPGAAGSKVGKGGPRGLFRSFLSCYNSGLGGEEVVDP